MMNRTGRWLLAVGVLVVLVAGAWWAVDRADPASVDDGEDVEGAPVAALPPPLPYEFVWLPGATRGVDVPHEIYIASTGTRLPLTFLGDLASEPGEDKTAFLQRVRHAMVAYSDKQTYEACALICSDGQGGHSVRMTTVGAVNYCPVAPVCVAGQSSVQQTIHSHCPKRPGLRATKADELISGRKLRRNRHFGMCDPDAFSSMDYAGWRPGWLAGVNALYRHDGPGQVTAYP